MDYFEEKLFKKVFKHWRKYKIEIVYITLSSILLLLSAAMYLYSTQQKTEKVISYQEQKKSAFPKSPVQNNNENEIFVDIAGSVENPDAYQITAGLRLKDLLIKAGGLSASADRIFFSRNYNLAKKLADGEKIYIPSKKEVEDGLFQDAMYIINNNNNHQPEKNDKSVNGIATQLININYASQKQLEELPGVGEKTAEKIISNRPFNNITDLVDKKIVNKGVWEKIKDLIII